MNLPIEAIILIAVTLLLFVSYLLLSLLSKGKNEEWKNKVNKELSTIVKLQNNGSNESSEQALMKADKLLDFTMKNVGIRGEYMGQRLKNAQNKFNKPMYNNIWEAHKLRNKIVHEVGISIPKKTIDKNINYLKSAVKSLI